MEGVWQSGRHTASLNAINHGAPKQAQIIHALSSEWRGNVQGGNLWKREHNDLIEWAASACRRRSEQIYLARLMLGQRMAS